MDLGGVAYIRHAAHIIEILPGQTNRWSVNGWNNREVWIRLSRSALRDNAWRTIQAATHTRTHTNVLHLAVARPYLQAEKR